MLADPAAVRIARLGIDEDEAYRVMEEAAIRECDGGEKRETAEAKASGGALFG
jgi:hypothetical protein